MKHEKFAVTGMTCSACSARVEQSVAKLPGIQDAAVDLDNKSAQIQLSQPVADDVFRVAVNVAGSVLAGIQ